MCFLMFSCLKNETVEHNDANTDPLVDANGINYMFLSNDYNKKFCIGERLVFLKKVPMEQSGQIVIIITVPFQISNFHYSVTMVNISYHFMTLIALPHIVKDGEEEKQL